MRAIPGIYINAGILIGRMQSSDLLPSEPKKPDCCCAMLGPFRLLDNDILPLLEFPADNCQGSEQPLHRFDLAPGDNNAMASRAQSAGNISIMPAAPGDTHGRQATLHPAPAWPGCMKIQIRPTGLVSPTAAPVALHHRAAGHRAASQGWQSQLHPGFLDRSACKKVQRSN